MGSFNLHMSNDVKETRIAAKKVSEVKIMSKEARAEERTLREEARKAKLRIKSGFWTECQENMEAQKEEARRQGLNESKAGRYFHEQVTAKIAGEKEDEFYLRVKEILTSEGEVSDAIGRLTDK